MSAIVTAPLPLATQPVTDSSATRSMHALQTIAAELLDVCNFLHHQGWTPATSSNFSARDPNNPDLFFISASGRDKGKLTTHDFIAMGLDGEVVFRQDLQQKPSAEMLLHALIYQRSPQINSVLHTHSVSSTVISKLYEAPSKSSVATIPLNQFEILKGLAGIQTHDEPLHIPVFPNSQDIPAMVSQIHAYMDAHADEPLHGFLIAGHGLYAWGDTLAEAKRHIETFEFLWECILQLRLHGYTDLT